jgi:hypothetical protein
MNIWAMIIASANAKGKVVAAGFSRAWLVAGGFIPRRRRPGMNPRPTGQTALKGANATLAMIASRQSSEWLKR